MASTKRRQAFVVIACLVLTPPSYLIFTEVADTDQNASYVAGSAREYYCQKGFGPHSMMELGKFDRSLSNWYDARKKAHSEIAFGNSLKGFSVSQVWRNDHWFASHYEDEFNSQSCK
jgi:hypothetical protein